MLNTSCSAAGAFCVVVAAHVRDVDAAERRDLVAQLRQFVLVGVDARHVVEAAREPDRALLHAFADESPASACSSSAVGLRGSRPITSIRTLPLGISVQALIEHCPSNCARYSVTVRHSRPGVGKLPLKPAVYCRMYVCVFGRAGREGDAVLAEHVRGHALPHALFVDRIGEQGEVAVNVGVDEAGADDLARGVEGLLRGGRAEPADGRDAVAGDADIGVEPRQAGAVHDPAVANEDVEHGGSRLGRSSRSVVFDRITG